MVLAIQALKRLHQQKHEQELGQEPRQNKIASTLTSTERDARKTASAPEMREQTQPKQKQQQQQQQQKSKQENTTTAKKPEQSHKLSTADTSTSSSSQPKTNAVTMSLTPAFDAAFEVTQATIPEISLLYECTCKGEARKYCLWTHFEVEDKRREVMVDVGAGATAKTWEKERWKWDEEFDPRNQVKKDGKREVKKRRGPEG